MAININIYNGWHIFIGMLITGMIAVISASAAGIMLASGWTLFIFAMIAIYASTEYNEEQLKKLVGVK